MELCTHGLRYTPSSAVQSCCLVQNIQSIDLETLKFLAEYHSKLQACFGCVTVLAHSLGHSRLLRCFML